MLGISFSGNLKLHNANDKSHAYRTLDTQGVTFGSPSQYLNMYVYVVHSICTFITVCIRESNIVS
jgi:hypothetical protein